MMRNQYPRRSAQSFDEGYAPSRGSRRQYRNTQSNSLDLSRRGNSIEMENPAFLGQAAPMMSETYGTNLPLPPNPGNIYYQATPYSGPPICSPFASKNFPFQDILTNNPKSDDGSETTPRNTNTANSEESDQPHYLYPIYDPQQFTALHPQAVTYHNMPGCPVGYAVIQNNDVKLVPQADCSNLANQLNNLQLNNPVPQTPPPAGMNYSTATPLNPYTTQRGIPYATMEGPYSTPSMNPPPPNIAYVTSNMDSSGMIYGTPMPVGSCGMTYASPPADPSFGIPYQGYPNTMYLPMYTMLPNVVPAQQYPFPPSQYDASMPGSSGSNTN